jgi:stearoyl-CoA desaturase (delta-9 desaturase)
MRQQNIVNGLVVAHLGCLLIIWSGTSWIAIATCIALYFVRMFGITAGYHRYFSHRTYKTSRFFQFVLAFLGATAGQKGPLWWAAHHRQHHRVADTVHDVHSPVVLGFWEAQIGWGYARQDEAANEAGVPDLAKFPELRFLEYYAIIPPVTLAILLVGFGTLLKSYAPQLHTSAFQMLAWGFFVSTVVLFHGTSTINSLAHIIGSRRFDTKDNSRNNFWLALITMGEGWHNNHHYYPSSEQQGFYWWEIDMSHYILTILSWLGIIWDVQKPPQKIYTQIQNKEKCSV